MVRGLLIRPPRVCVTAPTLSHSCSEPASLFSISLVCSVSCLPPTFWERNPIP